MGDQRKSVSKLQKHRKRKPFRKVLDDIAGEHDGVRSVTNTSGCYFLVFGYDYPNKLVAVAELFNRLKDLPVDMDYRFSVCSGMDGKKFKIDFRPFDGGD